MTAHGMEYPALFGQVGSACPAVSLPGFPSWIPVKINPVLAEPRTAGLDDLKVFSNLNYSVILLCLFWVKVLGTSTYAGKALWTSWDISQGLVNLFS